MKLNLFFSVPFIFTVLHICKAGPLRLHKRAAFYIANETACVVDNIVYTSGDPIPTDDPCEACKCRPPGFACVLKDCKVKPGCRAIRHVGECCPEYICGCEHNGRFYQDGEEIRDPKNPCYTCYCQGSSIACAFAECIFRNDCETEFFPGECCPKYTNCTEDTQDRNSSPEKNVLPSINLLPAQNDESILTGDFPTSQAPESHKATTDLNLSSESTENEEQKVKPGSETSAEIFNESAESELESSGYEKSTENVLSKDETESLAKVEENDASNTSNDEIEALLNSAPEIKDVSAEKDSLKDASTLEKQNSEGKAQTADVNEFVENDAEVTETSQRDESTSTRIPPSDQVRNSVFEKGKSLRLSDDNDQTKDSEEKVQEDESKEEIRNEKVTTQVSTEAPSQVVTDAKEGATESRPESLENTATERQTNSQSASFYGSNEKIKSESAETVTIVVHVKEKAKIPTETDFITDSTTPESVTKEIHENVPKYNSELQNVENIESSSDIPKTESTIKNFEIFSTKNDQYKAESSSDFPTTRANLEENIKERSDEISVVFSKDEKNKEKQIDGLHSQDLSSSADAKENDERDKTATVKDAIKPIEFEVITDSTDLPKSEDSIKTSTEETEVSKLEGSQPEGREDETKLEVVIKETKIKEIKPEEKVDETKQEEKVEETKQDEKAEETKLDEIKTEETAEEAKLEEIKPEEKAGETTLEEKAEETTLEENAGEITLEEKAEETKLEEIKLEEKTEKTKLEENAEEIKLEEIKLETTPEQKPEKLTSENTHENSTEEKKRPILNNVDQKPEERAEITSPEPQETSTKISGVTEREKNITSEETKSENHKNDESKQSEITNN